MASEALRIQGLTRRFGSLTAVDSMDLSVGEGDVYGFLGPNGAGKTTAIRCALGLLRPDEGSVQIFGRSDPVACRGDVGALVETPAFHEGWTARQEMDRALALSGAGEGMGVDDALTRVGLSKRADHKAGTFSLGMRQRLGIARAILGRPRLLILDEPTNGLDPRGRKEVRDLLVRLAHEEGMTIFLSSHLLSEVEQICTRVGVIDRGRLVAEGTVDELSAGGAVYVEVAVDSVALARALPQLDGVSLEGDGQEGRVRLKLVGVEVSFLNRRLVELGVEVAALVPVGASLEALYLSLTKEDGAE